jgi:hypothetical protein
MELNHQIPLQLSFNIWIACSSSNKAVSLKHTTPPSYLRLMNNSQCRKKKRSQTDIIEQQGNGTEGIGIICMDLNAGSDNPNDTEALKWNPGKPTSKTVMVEYIQESLR